MRTNPLSRTCHGPPPPAVWAWGEQTGVSGLQLALRPQHRPIAAHSSNCTASVLSPCHDTGVVVSDGCTRGARGHVALNQATVYLWQPQDFNLCEQSRTPWCSVHGTPNLACKAKMRRSAALGRGWNQACGVRWPPTHRGDNHPPSPTRPCPRHSYMQIKGSPPIATRNGSCRNSKGDRRIGAESAWRRCCRQRGRRTPSLTMARLRDDGGWRRSIAIRP